MEVAQNSSVLMAAVLYKNKIHVWSQQEERGLHPAPGRGLILSAGQVFYVLEMVSCAPVEKRRGTEENKECLPSYFKHILSVT